MPKSKSRPVCAHASCQVGSKPLTLKPTKAGCLEKRQPRGIFVRVTPLECVADSGLFVLSWATLGMPFLQLSPHHFAPFLLPSSTAPHPRHFSPVARDSFPSRHSRLHHTPGSSLRVKRTGPMPFPHRSQISVI